MIVLQRLAVRIAYRLAQVWWFVARPHTRGVKLVVRSGDEVLFVRHTYGSRRWELPGGGCKRGETPEQAGRREAEEELGLKIGVWEAFGQHDHEDFATAHLTCLAATSPGRELRLGRAEIAEARWARPGAPPRPLGEHAEAVLGMLGSAGCLSGTADRDART
jgi:8-oxo-dGTP pyrophosphatase MutT (NUDIX family)